MYGTFVDATGREKGSQRSKPPGGWPSRSAAFRYHLTRSSRPVGSLRWSAVRRAEPDMRGARLWAIAFPLLSAYRTTASSKAPLDSHRCGSQPTPAVFAGHEKPV